MAKRPKNGDSKEAQKRITKCRESGSTELNLSELDLVSVTKEIASLTSLTEFWLNNNQLTSVPKELGKLPELDELDLEDNKIQSLPGEFEELPAFSLWLRGNDSLEIPESILGPTRNEANRKQQSSKQSKEILNFYLSRLASFGKGTACERTKGVRRGTEGIGTNFSETSKSASRSR